MTQPIVLLIQTFAVTLLLFLWPALAQQAIFKVSTLDELKSEFTSVPCNNDDRLLAAKALFERMGAPPSDIATEKYKGVENLVVRRPGLSSEIIILGAHYDKEGEGCGAVDNWSGIVTLAHLYRTLKNLPIKKTLLFVAFGKEEKGLVGSRAMVKSITKEQAAQYCAMICIDSLGLAAPQVADNLSSVKLGKLTAELAQDMKMPFGHAAIAYADTDSSPFLSKKIPSVAIHGLTNEWPKILHSRNDQAEKVNPMSVYLGYRLVLMLTAKIDETGCDAFR